MKKQAKAAPKPAGNPAWLLRLPPVLSAPVMADCEKSGQTVQSQICEILARHYQIELPSRVGGRPRKPATE